MYITFYQEFQKFKQTKDDIFLKYIEDKSIKVDEELNNIQEKRYIKVTKQIDNKYALNYICKHNALHKARLITYSNFKDDMTKKEIESKYRRFKIPKKSNPNKMRTIDAPKDDLKQKQTLIKDYLEKNVNIQVHNAAHAYVKDRSALTANKVHQKNNSKWFLKLDIENFFPSHNEIYIRNMLHKIYPFGAYTELEETSLEDIIIKYALLEDKLPQGTPLSPILTNILMIPIDTEITTRLRDFDKVNIVYTEYADDLTLSSKHKFNPEKVINEIEKILNEFNTPFKINKEKTKFGSSSGKNWNLGMMLNKDNNITIGHRKNQQFRAMLYNFITDYKSGNIWNINQIYSTMGLISYYKMIEPDYINFTLEKYGRKYDIDIIKTMKNIIYGV